VYNSALYGLIIWCVGCIIPTPLDRAPTQTNFSPVFVTNSVTPLFGALAATIDQPTTLSLAATDPNADDALVVHLFQPDPTTKGSYILLQPPIALIKPTNPDPNGDPNLRLGSQEVQLCLNAPDNFMTDVYAVVADRPFNAGSSGADIILSDGGLTDSNHWEVTCSSM
jgi:hypothetical protein